jgi:hypothetical protein
MTGRRFPAPWTIIEHAESFWVQDAGGQTVGWFYFRTDPLVAKTHACCSRTRPGGWRRTSPGCQSCWGRAIATEPVMWGAPGMRSRVDPVAHIFRIDPPAWSYRQAHVRELWMAHTTHPVREGRPNPSGLPSLSRPPVRPFIVAPKLVACGRMIGLI